jgi:hypothetical protein
MVIVYHVFHSLCRVSRGSLNEYAAQVFDIVQPLGKSIYQVNGTLANLESYEYVIFQIDDIGKIGTKQYNRLVYLLQQFTVTIGKMPGDYKSNPWYGSIVPTVSHELRYDVGQKLSLLLPKTQAAQIALVGLYDRVSLSWETSYQAICDIIPVLRSAVQAPVVPVAWIFGNDIEPLFDEATECESLKDSFWQYHSEFEKRFLTIATNDPTFILSPLVNIVKAEIIEKEIARLTGLIATQFPYSSINVDYTIAQEFFYCSERYCNPIKQNGNRYFCFF